MKKPTLTPATGAAFRRIHNHTAAQALACGLALGVLVWLMAQLRQGNPVSQAMALMFVIAAATAFVFYALNRPGAPPAAGRPRLMRVWLCLLGSGVLASLHGLNFLLHGV